ncbi:TPA: hypothetical protein ACH3X3_009812 [Trebouxia sp. C0006]
MHAKHVPVRDLARPEAAVPLTRQFALTVKKGVFNDIVGSIHEAALAPLPWSQQHLTGLSRVLSTMAELSGTFQTMPKLLIQHEPEATQSMISLLAIMSLLIQTLGFASCFGQVLKASLTFTTVLCDSGPAYRSPQARQALLEVLYDMMHQLAYTTPAQKPQMPYSDIGLPNTDMHMLRNLSMSVIRKCLTT